MIVVIGERIPARVRGVLCLWMLEPKPGVFIGSLNSSVESKLFNFIMQYLEADSGISVYRSSKGIQGFSMYSNGDVSKRVVFREGIALIKNKIDKNS